VSNLQTPTPCGLGEGEGEAHSPAPRGRDAAGLSLASSYTPGWQGVKSQLPRDGPEPAAADD